MKILFVTSRFFPHGDAQSGVVFNLAEGLMKAGCDVHVLALSGHRDDRLVTEWKGVPVTQAYYRGSMVREEVREAIRKNPVQGFLALAEIACGMLLRKALPACRKRFLNPLTVHAYRKAIRQELKKESWDLCLATLMPMDAVHAAYRECEGKVPVSIYELDTYWNNVMLPAQYRNERFAYEKELMTKSPFCIVLPTIAKSNLEKDPSIADKIVCADMPVVKKPPENRDAGEKSEGFHCVFLGMLYPGLRPPEKVVSVLSRLKTADVVFDFYGTRQDLIEKSPDYPKAKRMLALHGPVPTDEASRARTNADVLINIDNTNVVQVPSKIFEYISTGKPIVNFYFWKESTVLDYLSRYPLAVSIDLNGDLDKAAEDLEAFLAGVDGRQIPYGEIEKLFVENTPEHVARKCIEAYHATVKQESNR